MERPKEITTCPFCCKKTVELKIEDFRYLSTYKKRITDGKNWIYRCSSCNEGFTSCESDEISQKTWKHREL